MMYCNKTFNRFIDSVEITSVGLHAENEEHQRE